MWISRKDYDILQQERLSAQAENKVLSTFIASLTSTLDWARVRLTQVEHEKAQLLFNYTGVKILSPSIEKEVTRPTMQQAALDAGVNFNDLGDAEARRLGIGWNTDGTLNPGTKE